MSLFFFKGVLEFLFTPYIPLTLEGGSAEKFLN